MHFPRTGREAFIILLLWGTTACQAPPTAVQVPASEAEIEAHLQRRLGELAFAYPDARLSDFRFTSDRRVVCGTLTTPGEEPFLFSSHDASPATIEDRPLGVPVLVEPGSWNHPINARGQERIRNQCRRAGLLDESAPPAESD